MHIGDTPAVRSSQMTRIIYLFWSIEAPLPSALPSKNGANDESSSSSSPSSLEYAAQLDSRQRRIAMARAAKIRSTVAILFDGQGAAC